MSPARVRKRAPALPAAANGKPGSAVPALPPEWRTFVGRWLESASCTVKAAARGDWEVDLSEPLRRRWRRQRMRLVFDPQRPTLPRGAWFAAPGSGAGRKLLDAATERPEFACRTALARVPGAPENGFGSVCRVRGLTWGPPRLGPVRYERRIAIHAVVTRWGGLPWQESWALLMSADGAFIEWASGLELPDLRTRDGLYQITDSPAADQRARWMAQAHAHLDRLLGEREAEWERGVGAQREEELERLGEFFASRIAEEEERLRRRTGAGDDGDLDHGDATSLKLEWERRAAEVRGRWALRTEIRTWGVVEWSWPVALLEQELKTGAVHVRLVAPVDVARGKPAQPGCPTCGQPAELLVRSRGSIGCEHCA
jgi:hypothetical protein